MAEFKLHTDRLRKGNRRIYHHSSTVDENTLKTTNS